MVTPAPEEISVPKVSAESRDEDATSATEEFTGEDEEEGEAQLVEMVPCALLEDGELVELQSGPGDATYIALDDGEVLDDGTGQGLIYYATPYSPDLEAFEAVKSGRVGTKSFLDGQYAATGPGNSAGQTGEAEGSREESPEVKTEKEKTIARVVMAVACTLFILCVVLVGVTLSMSDHITSMVRQMHFSSKSEPKSEPTAATNHTAYSSREGSRL